MLHPSYSDLMNAVNGEGHDNEHAPIQSRYSIVVAAAKRARQLVNGEEALVSSYENNVRKKPLSIAIEEIHKQKLGIVDEGTSEY